MATPAFSDLFNAMRLYSVDVDGICSILALAFALTLAFMFELRKKEINRTTIRCLITRKIREGSSPTMRGHFSCIFKTTAEYRTGVWWAFYMRTMGT